MTVRVDFDGHERTRMTTSYHDSCKTFEVSLNTRVCILIKNGGQLALSKDKKEIKRMQFRGYYFSRSKTNLYRIKNIIKNWTRYIGFLAL